MGNFASKGDLDTTKQVALDALDGLENRYTKTESDGRYPLKTVFDTAIKTANDGLADRYTKTESDGRYPAVATYNEDKTNVNNTITSINEALTARYTKTESDARYPALATYNTAMNDRYTKEEIDNQNRQINSIANKLFETTRNELTARYTKTESDARYPALATYNTAMNDRYTKAEVDNRTNAINTTINNGLTARYTKTESDARYPAIATYNTDKTNVNNTFTTINNGLAARYTKTESDARYPALATYNTAINDRYTKAEVDAKDATINTKMTSLVNTNTLNDLKPRTMWCADGELCTVPDGKKGFTNGKVKIIDGIIANDNPGEAGRLHISGTEKLFILNKGGAVVSKAWTGNGNLEVEGELWTRDDLTVNRNAKVVGNSEVNGQMNVYAPQGRQSNMAIQSGTNSRFWVSATAGDNNNKMLIGGIGATAPVSTTPIVISSDSSVDLNGVVRANKGMQVSNGNLSAKTIQADKIQIGKWVFETHPGTGNLHLHYGNVEDWTTSAAVADQTFHTRKIRSENRNIMGELNNLNSNAVQYNSTIRIRGRRGDEYLQTADAWDARTSSNRGAWERWYLEKE